MSCEQIIYFLIIQKNVFIFIKRIPKFVFAIGRDPCVYSWREFVRITCWWSIPGLTDAQRANFPLKSVEIVHSGSVLGRNGPQSEVVRLSDLIQGAPYRFEVATESGEVDKTTSKPAVLVKRLGEPAFRWNAGNVYYDLRTWASEGGQEGLDPPWILKISATKGCFPSLEWEKTNFTTFGPS